jgi:predicted metal-dependent hydrolase
MSYDVEHATHLINENVIVHEMIHQMEPTHSGRFMLVIYRKYPTWRDPYEGPNELPLSAEN